MAIIMIQRGIRSTFLFIIDTIRGAYVPGSNGVVCNRKLFTLVQIAVTIAAVMSIFMLIYDQNAAIYIKCPCDNFIPTGYKEKRFLKDIMLQTDNKTGRTALDAVRSENPSLAIDFLLANEYRGYRCHLTPSLFSIKHNNEVWQEARVGTSNFLLFSAFYDTRSSGGPVVRILAVSDSAYPFVPTCHFYIDEEEDIVATRAVNMEYIHWQNRVDGQWNPFLISCQVGEWVPHTVSLVEHSCEEATNALVVNHAPKHSLYNDNIIERFPLEKEELVAAINQEKLLVKEDIAICHKFLFNELDDHSSRLVEWLEAAKAWGISKVIFYRGKVHPNVELVLEHYIEEGLVKLEPWNNPGHYPNTPSLQRAFYDTQRFALFTLENIPYIDCLLKNMNSHRYIGVWDIDEFIIPANPFNSIADMIDSAKLKWWRDHAELCDLHTELNIVDQFQPSLSKAIVRIDDLMTEFNDSETSKQLFIQSIDRAGLHKLNANPDCKLPTSYLGMCSYFLDDIKDPSDEVNKGLHFLTHLQRTMKFSSPYVFTKGVHDTNRALGLHGHFALFNVEGPVNRSRDLYHLYPHTQGYLGHYRPECQGDDQTVCNEEFRPYLIRDETMMKHRQQMIRNTNATFYKLFNKII